MMKVTRIRWTMEEWTKIVKYLMKNLSMECKSSTLIGIKEEDIKLAQSLTLPEDRHRRGVLPMTAIRSMLFRRFRDLEFENPPSNTEESDTPNTEKSDVNSIINNIFNNSRSQNNAVESLLTLPVSSLLDSLVEGLADKIFDKIVDRISTQTTNPTESISMLQTVLRPKHNPFPIPSSRIKKPGIIIIGPTPDQSHVLQKSFPDFQISTTWGDSPNLKFMLRQCDRSIGMASKMSHSSQDKAKSIIGKKYVAIHGGISAIQRQLKIWHSCWQEDENFFEKIPA